MTRGAKQGAKQRKARQCNVPPPHRTRRWSWGVCVRATPGSESERRAQQDTRTLVRTWGEGGPGVEEGGGVRGDGG